MSPLISRPAPLSYKPPHGIEVDWSHPLAQFLRGFWLLTEEGGTAAANLAYPGLNNGSLTNSPTWVQTAAGGGLSFAGTNQNVNVGRGALLDDLPDQTFEALIYYGGSTGSSQRIIAKMNSSFYNGLMLTSGGNVEYQRDRATLENYYLTTAALAADGLYHLIGTHEFVSGATQVYINGVSTPASSSDIGSGALVSDSAVDLLLGNRSDNARAFKGTIIFARVWSMYTTPAVAEELYANPYGILLNQQLYPRLFSTASQFSQSVAGSLASAGAVSRRGNKAVAGTLTTAAALTRRINTTKAGALTGAGALIRQTGKPFTGNLGATGGIGKQASKGLAGSLTSTGAATKQTRTSKSGVLAPSGALAAIRTVLMAIAGFLSMSGAVGKRINTTEAGTLTSSGTATKQTRKGMVGSLTTSATLSSIRAFLRTVAGALSMSGSATKQTRSNQSGSLASAGTITKQTNKNTGGVFSSDGALMRARIAVMALFGALGVSGTVTKQISTTTGGVLISSGSIIKRISRTIGGVLGALGTVISTFLAGNQVSVDLVMREEPPLMVRDEPTLMVAIEPPLKMR